MRNTLTLDSEDDVRERKVQMEDWCLTAYCKWGLTFAQFIFELSDAFDTLEQIDPGCEK